jgi:hypothetical protein
MPGSMSFPAPQSSLSTMALSGPFSATGANVHHLAWYDIEDHAFAEQEMGVARSAGAVSALLDDILDEPVS